MAKKNTEISYRCGSCGYTQSKWLGRCPSCGAWNAFEEVPVFDSHQGIIARENKIVEVVPLEAVKSQDEIRLSTGLKEFDRVLGGGAIKRSSIIVAGEPGIGKSTLLSIIKDEVLKDIPDQNKIYLRSILVKNN